jgi:hypothetical protein
VTYEASEGPLIVSTSDELLIVMLVPATKARILELLRSL